jgi:hypothetical protein
MIAYIAFLAALSLGPAVDARPDSPPTTIAQDAAANRAIADRIIAAAGAESVFVNSSKADVAQVTHVASGMTCRFQGLPTDRITIFPTVEGGPRGGDDVGLHLSRRQSGHRFYTLRDPIFVGPQRGPGPQQRQCRNPEPLARRHAPIPATWQSARIEGQSVPLVSAFKIGGGDGEMLTLAMVSHRDDWAFKIRATGPYGEAKMVSLYSAMLLESALMSGAAD